MKSLFAILEKKKGAIKCALNKMSRTDISGKITGKLVAKMDDGNWKLRKEGARCLHIVMFVLLYDLCHYHTLLAMDAVQEILEGASHRIGLCISFVYVIRVLAEPCALVL